MKIKIFNVILLVFLSIACLNTVFASSVYAADSNTSTSDICNDGKVPDEIKKASGCTTTQTLPKVIENILNIIIGAAGTVAAVFVLIGGINYMTSTGDAGKVEKAKKTILYACIGLIVCALSYAIVNWTINALPK